MDRKPLSWDVILGMYATLIIAYRSGELMPVIRQVAALPQWLQFHCFSAYIVTYIGRENIYTFVVR